MILILIGLLIIQYFAAKNSLNALVGMLDRFLPRGVVFGIISLLFFPGTVVHEGAHAITALCLFLPVHRVHLIPEWDHKSIKLGHVEYEKRGLWRSILVGLAPLPFGLLALWGILSWQLPVWLTGYLIFVVTSTMFSSKSDLVDAIYIIPLAIVGVVVWLAFPTVFAALGGWIVGQKGLVEGFNSYVLLLCYYVGVALGIHVGIMLLGWVVRVFARR